jgi:5-formyltetrahydrofolate cyclo-ligase
MTQGRPRAGEIWARVEAPGKLRSSESITRESPMTMIDHSDEGREPGAYASPACLMHEVNPDYFGLASGAASVQRENIMRWRKNERKRLIAQRLAISNDERIDRARHIGAHLDVLLPDLAGISVSLYWPFRGEPDLRGWAEAIRARGATCALPVVVEKNAPLIFRLWRASEPLALGVWNIPIPANGAELVPDVVIAPVVGFDQQGYRLGYGGAFYDRTLAALTKKPRAVGVGYSQAAIATIYPLHHDIPMDVIVTEEGIVERSAS